MIPTKRFIQHRSGYPASRQAMAWNARRCGLPLDSEAAWLGTTLYEPGDSVRYRFVRSLLDQLGSDDWAVVRVPSPTVDGVSQGTTVIAYRWPPGSEPDEAHVAQIMDGEWLDPETGASTGAQ